MTRSDWNFHLARRRFVGLCAAVPFGLGGAAARAQSARGEAGLSDAETKEAASIRDKARKVGIGPFRLASGDHFLVIGDASDHYRNEVLGFCESLGKAFLSYYKSKGFTVSYPEGDRMAVVVLKDRKSYGAWIGESADEAIGGHYDRDSNRLVVFDFRDDPLRLGDQARVVNSFTLSHEANHLLGFNTGLLNRDADIPTCIIEGLATVGELFQKTRQSAIGDVNTPRTSAFAEATRNRQPWIDLVSLLKNDEACENPETYQLAYAESWLLIYTLMRSPEKRGKLRTYLDRLRKPGADKDRIREAEDALGPLDKLNRELRRSAGPYLQR